MRLTHHAACYARRASLTVTRCLLLSRCLVDWSRLYPSGGHITEFYGSVTSNTQKIKDAALLKKQFNNSNINYLKFKNLVKRVLMSKMVDQYIIYIMSDRDNYIYIYIHS